MNPTWLDQYRHFVFVGLSALAIGGAGIFYFRQPAQSPIEILAVTPTATTVTATALPPATATPAPVRVYVTGAVQNSDVYFLPPGSIVKDAIEVAGGLTADADPVRINQALELVDQQQIHVPKRDEENPPPPVQNGQPNPTSASSPKPSASGGVINLNTATLEQLDTLPGIGPAIAQRIIDYRDSVGGFTTVEEITQVSGIGSSTFARIKGSITIN